MRDLLVSLLVFGSLPVILGRPHVGVLVWSWLAYMSPHRLTYGFAYTMSFSLFVGVATLISVLFTKEPRRIPWLPPVVALLLFDLWMGLTTMLAVFPDRAWEQADKVLKIQLMTFVTLMVMKSRERILALLWVIGVSIGFYTVKGGVFTILTGGQFMVNGPPGSYLEGNNALGLAAVMLVPLLRYLHLETAGVWVRRGLLAAMVLTVLSAVASYSRGALLAAFAMGLFLWSKSPRKLPLALGTAVVAAFLLQFMPEEWFDRMGTIQTYEEDRSAMGRVNAWWFAWNYALAHPIAGGGFDVVQPSVFVHYAPDPAHFADTHSIYFSVLAHHGFVGLFLFLLVLFLTWRSGSRIIRAARGRDELRWAHHLASMIQVSLVGYLVGGAFLNLAYWDLPYSLLAILVLTEYLVSQQGAELARVPADAGPPQTGPPGGEVPVAVGPAVSVPPPGHASKHGPGQGEGLAGGRHSLRGGTPAGPWL